ncbi:hypothetical protein Barb6_01936 [Bacteroidales bacterium Barb6]|nr:hypothetical protein Barb6_01936 [Bacteroidales bacterium Barb6]
MLDSMKFIFSKHAEEQMLRRGLDKDQVLTVIQNPDEIIADDSEEVVIFQSVIKENEQLFLLRVFINRSKQPKRIVTLYKTTKIKKYYEGKI